MTDVLTKSQRSHCMGRVRSQGTRPEITLRKALWTEGLRYRLKSKLPGKPDIVFPTPKVVVFVDGCFWHRCPIHRTEPRTNAAFWQKKLDRNVERDREVTNALTAKGWLVVRVWQHELRDLPQVVERIKSAVHERSSRHGNIATE